MPMSWQACRIVRPFGTSTSWPSIVTFGMTRPYSAESIRWRVEAMCIRSVAVDDGSGPILQGEIDSGNWGRRGQLIAVFNPKGGVGKTTIALNLAAVLTARGQRVLMIDADTVTGHVDTSLGMEGVPILAF